MAEGKVDVVTRKEKLPSSVDLELKLSFWRS
jgi:hypothetical protein